MTDLRMQRQPAEPTNEDLEAQLAQAEAAAAEIRAKEQLAAQAPALRKAIASREKRERLTREREAFYLEAQEAVRAAREPLDDVPALAQAAGEAFKVLHDKLKEAHDRRREAQEALRQVAVRDYELKLLDTHGDGGRSYDESFEMGLLYGPHYVNNLLKELEGGNFDYLAGVEGKIPIDVARFVLGRVLPVAVGTPMPTQQH